MIKLSKIVEKISKDYAGELLYRTFHNNEYVFKDFVMSDNGFSKELERILRDDPDVDEEELEYEFEDWVEIKWKLKVLELNASDFTKSNQKTMIKRKFGNANVKCSR